ncbi:hypothetical protein AVW11_27975 [Streptomyces amritsarensis]|uniref:Barstar (barnase inhibitor) domain-containing protein n=1 Tax=Streptomyces amritsarensis TaxID=681158 RepID=A0ABX3FW24_9ACTN|nr:hypothetical protein AVW11_27975 [Streptomyces amritsarensis]
MAALGTPRAAPRAAAPATPRAGPRADQQSASEHQKPKQSAIAVECNTSQRQPLRGVAACPAVRPAVIDVGPVRSERDLHEALKRECGFPAFYGMNPDAFVGCDHRPCRHARTPAVHRLGRSGAAGENRRPRTSPSSTTPVRHVPRTAPAAPRARPRKARPGKAPRRGRQAASRCPAGAAGVGRPAPGRRTGAGCGPGPHGCDGDRIPPARPAPAPRPTPRPTPSSSCRLRRARPGARLSAVRGSHRASRRPRGPRCAARPVPGVPRPRRRCPAPAAPASRGSRWPGR